MHYLVKLDFLILNVKLYYTVYLTKAAASQIDAMSIKISELTLFTILKFLYNSSTLDSVS